MLLMFHIRLALVRWVVAEKRLTFRTATSDFLNPVCARVSIDARHKFPLAIDFRIGNIGRKIGNMSENNYPTYFGNLL